MEILNFMFKSFWHFAGCFIVLEVLVELLINLISLIKKSDNDNNR